MADRTIYRDNAPIGLKDHVGDESVFSVEVWMTGGSISSGGATTMADGADVAQGTTTDPAASSTVAEDATTRTGISLLKGIKNILILVKDKLTALSQVEDTQHTSGDTGVMSLGVRKDTAPSAIAGTDGDYIPAIFDENGNLWVSLGTKIDKDNDEILVWANTAKDGTGTDYVPLVDSDGQLQVVEQATPVVTPVTGSGAIATSYAPAADFWLESVTLHLSSSGSTAEDFAITLNANDGGAYDTVLLSQDLSSPATTDLVYAPTGGRLLCESGDAIDVAWPNSESRVYGLRITARLA